MAGEPSLPGYIVFGPWSGFICSYDSYDSFMFFGKFFVLYLFFNYQLSIFINVIFKI